MVTVADNFGGFMVITFSAILFSLLFLFKGLQKNFFFIFYVFTMILTAYYCENKLGWHVKIFNKAAFLIFLLFHLPYINFFTFAAYGKDKRAAQKGEWRIPEIQLHTLELLGGTIGAFIGQKFFHHKNKKKSYMATFFANVFLQICLIVFIINYLHLW
jgi:uncharacterized membrane protein YsdA (DUF1294 family)